MAELKTKPTKLSVSKFIAGIADKEQREDSKVLVKMMSDVTSAEPKLWGTSIIGFGNWHYKSASGREGDWFATGFSPRKQALVLYLMGGFQGQPDLMKKLGKHKTGKGCLYIKRLSDVDGKVLKHLISASVKALDSYGR